MSKKLHCHGCGDEMETHGLCSRCQADLEALVHCPGCNNDVVNEDISQCPGCGRNLCVGCLGRKYEYCEPCELKGEEDA